MFKSSVCSYENRGPYGNNKYRGNCSGFIVKDFIESYMRKPNGLVADPSVGGGSSIDVANELGVRFKGTDLHQGFNLLRDDFLSFLGEPAHLIWWHPPYWDMIQYSGKQWGEPNKWDMSRMNLPEFVEALELAVMNIHDACERGGHYGILMGNLRRDGDYFNLSSLVERIAPGKLVRIAHEKLLVFRRNDVASSLCLLAAVHRRATNMVSTTWKAAIRRTLQGKTLKLEQIYKEIEPYAKHRENNPKASLLKRIVAVAFVACAGFVYSKVKWPMTRRPSHLSKKGKCWFAALKQKPM